MVDSLCKQGTGSRRACTRRGGMRPSPEVDPMGCPADDVLLAMVEHQLPPTRFAELEVHIDSCEQWRRAIAAVATSRELAQGTTAGDDLDRLESVVDLSLSDRYVIEALL